MAFWRPSESSEFDESKLPDLKVSRDFAHAHKVLVDRIKTCFAAYSKLYPERQVIVTCTFRHPEEQKRIFAQGRFGNKGPILTNCDGYTKKSLHNEFPARAVDTAILVSGKCIWDESYFYPLGNLAKAHGLEWGGFWTKFVDIPHFQLPKDVP